MRSLAGTPPLVLPEIPLFLLLNPGPSLTSYISSQCHLQAAFPYASPFPCRGQLTLPLCHLVPWPWALRPYSTVLGSRAPTASTRLPLPDASSRSRWTARATVARPPPIQGVSLCPGGGGQKQGSQWCLAPQPSFLSCATCLMVFSRSHINLCPSGPCVRSASWGTKLDSTPLHSSRRVTIMPLL